MSDETLDSGNANGGTPAQPSAGGSQGQGDSNGSSANQSQTLEQVLSRLEELDKRTRALQGEKDRGVNQNKREVEELKTKIAQIEKLTKQGIPQDEAIETLFEREELMEAARILRSQQNGRARPEPVGNGAGEAADKAKILAEYGLNENDPDVASALQNERDVEKVALKVALKRSQRQPDPASAPSGTAQPSSATSQQELQAAYQKELNAIRGMGRPSPIQIADLKKKYREKGLPVW